MTLLVTVKQTNDSFTYNNAENGKEIGKVAKSTIHDNELYYWNTSNGYGSNLTLDQAKKDVAAEIIRLCDNLGIKVTFIPELTARKCRKSSK